MPTWRRMKRTREQAPESARRCRTFPQHAENYGAKKGRNEETEMRLHVIHDALEMHDQVSGADADDHAYNRGQRPTLT